MRIDGRKIEELRKRKGKAFTQEAVANRLNMSQSNYSTKLKTGDFTTIELDTICKFLGIKKEQIQLDEGQTEVEKLDFLLVKAIQAESALTVLIGAVAEIQAKLNNGSAVKINADLLAAVNTLSKEALDELSLSK